MKQPDYKCSAFSPEKRVRDLLARMTLEEKAGADDMRLAGKILENLINEFI